MPRKLQPYQPQTADIAWAQNVIAICSDGATVGTSDGVYVLDKTKKVFRLTEPKDPGEQFSTFVMHHRHTYVWKAVGYTVEPVVDWEAFELPDKPTETAE